MTKPAVLTPIINDKLGLAGFMVDKLCEHFEIIPRDIYANNPQKYKHIEAVLIYWDLEYLPDDRQRIIFYLINCLI